MPLSAKVYTVQKGKLYPVKIPTYLGMAIGGDVFLSKFD